MSFSLCWPRTGSNRYSSISGGVRSSAGARRSSSFISRSLGSWHSKSSPVETSHAADRKSTRLNSSHVEISYAVFCLKKKKKKNQNIKCNNNYNSTQTKNIPTTNYADI